MSQAFSNNDNSIVISNVINCTAPDDRSEILAWLSPLEPRIRHRDIGAQRVDNVGDWLLETREFKRWHKGGGEGEPNNATLFCDGNPGVGKSYICSLVIDKLCDEATEEGAAVVCFYFDFAARIEQSPVNMLGSLLRQIVVGLGGIPEPVAQGFRSQRKVIGGRGLQISGILKMFQAIADATRTFICVDALDECVHRMVVLESLGQILQGSPDTRLFMTGRRHVRSEVERKLGGAATFVLIQPTEDGFIRYLHEKLRNDSSPDIMSATLEADIMKSIPEISSETFLLASLYVDAILRETTIARRGKRLKSMKDGSRLGDAYGATLQRIKAQDEEKTKLAIATLTWICHAERPLQVDELCHALAVEIGARDFDPENVPSISTLLGCCQGLITVDKEASTVRLIHFTAREYLCTHLDLFIKPQSILAETCLTYLNSQEVKNLSSDPLREQRSVPFLKYSARYWGTHANRELTVHARGLAMELLDKYEDHVSAISLLTQVRGPSSIGDMVPSPQFSGLHCASFFGIVELVTALINANGCRISQPDCIGRTPLLWAAKNGHEGVVKLLLECGNVGCGHPDKYGQTPLLWAAFDGHEGVVEMLLDCNDVDPNRPNVDGRTPLWCAAFKGHEGVVKLLLDHKDVDPNRPNKNDRTPLGSAAVKGYEGIVKLLLDRKDVDPNRPDGQHSTPLSWAANNGHEGVVKLLLDRKDVDPNRPDKNDQTPLGRAAVKGHEGVVKLLLNHKDVDPNRPDKNDRTPLGCAAVEGHEGVVKLLLDHKDVNPDGPDDQHSTPLLWVAGNGHEGVVKPLLDRKDIDPNHPGQYD